MNIADFIKGLVNSLLDGSFERMGLVNQMNKAFREYYVSGESKFLCKVSIAQGDVDFKHEMSSIWFRSGFKITIENDDKVRDADIMEISQYVLQNLSFVRQLMALGFDTLIVQGKTTKKGKVFSLKAYANLNNYYISQ